MACVGIVRYAVQLTPPFSSAVASTRKCATVRGAHASSGSDGQLALTHLGSRDSSPSRQNALENLDFDRLDEMGVETHLFRSRAVLAPAIPTERNQMQVFKSRLPN